MGVKGFVGGHMVKETSIEIGDNSGTKKIMEKIRMNIKKRKKNQKVLDIGDFEKLEIKNSPSGISEDVDFKDLDWNVENKSYVISSHRKLMGPLLIKGRELVHGEVRRYVDPVLMKQQEFNIKTVSMIDKLSKELTENREHLHKLSKELTENREHLHKLSTELADNKEQLAKLWKIRNERFKFQGKNYEYLYNEHNVTWTNERAVEIPIVFEILNQYKGKNILEVGNVLSWYFPVNHDVLDKYEKAAGVINKDIVDFKPSRKYDLIMSISTLEHIGWTKPEKQEPMKTLKAIKKMEGMLAPGGRMVITFPLGENPHLDNLFKRGKITFTRTYYMKRISKDNEWIEVDWKQICNARYNTPYDFANGLVIGIIEK